MGALGDVSAALAPAAQGLTQGQLAGAQTMLAQRQQAIENSFRQQQLHTEASQQAAQESYYKGLLAQQAKQADREDYATQLGLLANPDVVGQLSTTPVGRARLQAAHAAVNSYSQKYGWAGVPADVDATNPTTGPQAATQAIAQGNATAQPSAGGPTAPQALAQHIVGTMDTQLRDPFWGPIHRGTDLHSWTNDLRAALASGDDKKIIAALGRDKTATWHAATDLGLNGDTAAQVAAQHGLSGLSTTLSLPPGTPAAGKNPALAPGVAGPPAPPGSVRTSQGTLVPLPQTAPVGVLAGPQADSTPQFDPSAFLAAVRALVPPPPAGQGPAPSTAVNAAGAPPAAPNPAQYQVPTQPNPTFVPGAPGVPDLPQASPASQRALAYNPQARMAELAQQYPNMTPAQRQQIVTNELTQIGTSQQQQQASLLEPYQIIAASQQRGLNDAQIQNLLAQANYHWQLPEIEQAKARVANVQWMADYQLKLGQFGLDKQKAAVAADAEASAKAGRITTAQNEQFQSYLRADGVVNQELRNRLMGLRSLLYQQKSQARDEATKTVSTGSQGGGGGLNLPVGGVGVGVNYSARQGFIKTEGFDYGNGPAARALYNTQAMINKLVNSPGSYIARTYGEMQDLTRPIDARDLANVQAGLKGNYKDPVTSRSEDLVTAINALAYSNPAVAIRLNRAYNAARTANPKLPALQGIDLSPIAGGGSTPAPSSQGATSILNITGPAYTNPIGPTSPYTNPQGLPPLFPGAGTGLGAAWPPVKPNVPGYGPG